ncbi:hypothetical protein Patl1_36729 [Pistacia atlantica]|nr:hypothetical protein Patl1_36729 [Pistacia atlantica]
MDLSDLLSSSSSSLSFPHQPPKKLSQNPETKIPQTNPTKPEEFSASSEQEHGSNFGGVKLSRTTSVSSASVALQSAVKRAFSMKRSSSVSERYCRIHDQSVTLASPTDGIYYEDHGAPGNNIERSVKRKNSRTKILKACKRLLRL